MITKTRTNAGEYKSNFRAAVLRKLGVTGRGVMMLLLTVTAATPVTATTDPSTSPPKIQLAMLLDTSNSMDGLIGQTREQLWRIVNEFITAKQKEQRPVLEVALYEYGNAGLDPLNNWVRQVVPFTTDLDVLSENLFALSTRGGSEYCGVVLHQALDELAWSTVETDLKAIFIAGNEPFDQGPSDYRTASTRATKAGVIVNTIFCGERSAGVASFWQDGASLGEGDFFHIDQNRETTQIATPQDGEIERLGLKLNETYLPYGSGGFAGSSNQILQDSNASSLFRSSNVSRQVFKGSHLYSNGGWDLLDAQRDGTITVDQLTPDDLPAAMRTMSPEERLAYLESKRAERTAVQAQIQALDKARQAYIAERRKASAEVAPDSLEAAMIVALHKMAAQKGFHFR